MGTAHTHHMETTSLLCAKFQSWYPGAYTSDKTQWGLEQGVRAAGRGMEPPVGNVSRWENTAALLPWFSCALTGMEVEKSHFPSKCNMLIKHIGTAAPRHSPWYRESLSPNFPPECREVFLYPSTSAKASGKQSLSRDKPASCTS